MMKGKTYKKYDFFYKRTCFRLFSDYFKHLYAPYHSKWVAKRNKEDVSEYLLAFTMQTFSSVFSKMSGDVDK